MPTSAAPTPRQYAVFISYRHDDNRESGRQWATWLHHNLETYEVPPDLVGRPNLRGEPVPASLYPVFRDEEELPADADLNRNIERALENSALLVVLCSPRAVASAFVANEIRYFKELGKGNKILALLIDGEPNASRDPSKQSAGVAALECLPEPLRFGVAAGPSDEATGPIDWSVRTEPIAADVRPGNRAEQGYTSAAAYREALQSRQPAISATERDRLVHEYEAQLDLAKLKIVAGALSLPLGDLTQRDKAHQLARARKRARTARRLAAVFIVLAIAAGVAAVAAWVQREAAVAYSGEAERQRNEALASKTKIEDERNAALEAQERERKQRELVQKREEEQRQLLHHASMAAYTEAVQFIEEDGRWNKGVAHLTRALELEPGNSLATQRLYTTIALHALRHVKFLRAVLPAQAAINRATFSPDGSRVLTVSANHVAQMWDASTGNPIGEPVHDDANIESATFSPDGSKILTTRTEDEIRRDWTAITGEPLPQWLSNPRALSTKVSPDNSRLVTLGQDGTARVWNTANRKLVAGPMHHPGANQLTISPDGSTFVTVSSGPKPADQTARFWSVQTGKPVGQSMNREVGVLSAGFSPDGSRLLTVSRDNAVRIWNNSTGEPIGTPMRHEGAIESAIFSPDGLRVLTVREDHAARVWDTVKSELLGEPMQHSGRITTASFSPDGARILTSSEDQTACIWDATTGQRIGEPMRHQGAVRSAAFSPDGDKVVTASDDTTACIWDVRTVELLGEPISHDANLATDAARKVNDNNLSNPDGSKRLNVAGAVVSIEDTTTGTKVGEPLRHKGPVSEAHFDPDGHTLITVSADGDTPNSTSTKRAWRIDAYLQPPIPVTSAVRQWATAIAGWRADVNGLLQPIPAADRAKILSAELPGDDSWAQLARWLVTDTKQRTIHPDSSKTCREVAIAERDYGSKASLESALRYDSQVPLAHLLLAGTLTHQESLPETSALHDPTLPQHLAFLRDYDLQRLPDDPALWVRAIKSLHEQQDDARARQALTKLEKLAPEQAAALKKELGL